MESSRQPFRFDDPRHERIYRRLRDFVGPCPADFFKDACQLMANPASLGTTSHLVSHLLREIESALRDVLETMTEREKRLQKSKKDGQNHKEEILVILRGLQIPETDPVVGAWLRLPGEGNSYGFGARAHRNALTPALWTTTFVSSGMKCRASSMLYWTSSRRATWESTSSWINYFRYWHQSKATSTSSRKMCLTMLSLMDISSTDLQPPRG